MKQGRFSLDGQEFMAFDSALKHDFTFTPAMSIFVECESEEEIEMLYGRFMDKGRRRCRSAITDSVKSSPGVADMYTSRGS